MEALKCCRGFQLIPVKSKEIYFCFLVQDCYLIKVSSIVSPKAANYQGSVGGEEGHQKGSSAITRSNVIRREPWPAMDFSNKLLHANPSSKRVLL